MKNPFDGIISKLNIPEERISELKEMSITEIQREKTEEN